MYKRKRREGPISRPGVDLVPGKEILNQPIEILRLSHRSRTYLKQAGIVSIGHLLSWDDSRIISIRQIGLKSLSEIRNNLLSYLRLRLNGGDGPHNGGGRDRSQGQTPTLSQVSAGLLDLLNQRQREVITLRYGLNDTPPLTLARIGSRLKVTRERVRQIQDEALSILRTTDSSPPPRPISGMVYHILKKEKGLGHMDVVLKEVFASFPPGDRDPKLTLNFILAIDGRMQKKDRDIWGFREYPDSLAQIIGDRYLKILGKYGMLTREKILKEFSQTALYQRHKHLLSHEFLLACLEIQGEIIPRGNNLYYPSSSKLSCSASLTLLLRRAGRPLHYRELTREVRKLTQQGAKSYSPRYIHNTLVKKRQFQRVGRGTYHLTD